MINFGLHSQNLRINGVVTDEFQHPLAGATVSIEKLNQGSVTDRKGQFTLENLQAGTRILHYSFLGYKSVSDTLNLKGNINLMKKLCPANTLLNEVTVTDNVLKPKATASMSVQVLDKTFLQQQMSGSLMQTLERLPGVSSMDIGSGQSKPVIRGLGFHRVVVAENGVKHEAQEWGADHGLEIDRFAVERIEVIKGPASLMYGANAIGGVIDLKQIVTPEKNSFGGSVLLNGQTNNELLGVSAKLFRRFDKFYFKTHFSYSDYSDYQVPTDSISYMTYYFSLNKNRLRNTAGRERNGSVSLGYVDTSFSSHLSISDNWSKSGFFANAHGLEIRNSQINYDHSSRDIDLPYQQVNHLKVLSNSIWMITDYQLNVDLGYQHNYRQEFSEAVAHGYMPTPADSLERLYNKSTWTANLKLKLPQHNLHQFTTGINTEFQNNTSGGWGFMLPAYRTFSAGEFVYDFIRLTDKWTVNGGLRYDLGSIETEAYFDWYPTPQPDGSTLQKQRASALKRSYGSLSWGLGTVYTLNAITLKANIGKSFRMPTAKELSSNGINYHMYQFEKGDTTLRAEESYQLDLGLIYKKGKWLAELSPFINYFPNYIYLNPTADYYEAQQVFYHSQSEVFRSGGEILVNYRLTNSLNISADLEYVYSVQLSGAKKGYTLPFSPPVTSNIELEYSGKDYGIFSKPRIAITTKLVGAQNNIVPPEKKTPGYALLNLGAGTGLQVGKQEIQINLQAVNILNTRFYDHTSFYRLIEVPGQGRSFTSTIQISL